MGSLVRWHEKLLAPGIFTERSVYATSVARIQPVATALLWRQRLHAMSAKGLAAVAAAALLTSIVLAVPAAHADTDSDYLKLLAHFGISCANMGSSSCTDAGLIQMGHAVCADLEGGRDANSEVAGLVSHSSGNLSDTLAMYLIGAAVLSYCPAQKSALH
jgi:hypothetical protein